MNPRTYPLHRRIADPPIRTCRVNKAPTPQQALEVIVAHAVQLPDETVALRDAVGRVLREVVMPERDNPPFDRVCMDGVAIAAAAFDRGLRRFRVQGTQGAGAVPLALAAPDAAIEVMTGAMLPAGTDCVIPMEEYRLAGGELELLPAASARAARNVQLRGEDSRPGVAMLKPGVRIGAAEAAVIASAGLAGVSVARTPRVRIVSTGDELIEPGLPIAAHQVRRSNAYAITAALHDHGYDDVRDSHLADDAATIERAVRQLLDECEVLVLSGGVSTGKFDFVPRALAANGVAEHFHEVAQRPGRPMWFGTGPRGQLVFGLPGNPVATLVCLVRFVLPALAAICGAAPTVPPRFALSESFGPRKMTYFVPVKLAADAEGATLAQPRPPNGPGDFLALAGTDGFVELPPAPEGYPAGFIAPFHRW